MWWSGAAPTLGEPCESSVHPAMAEEGEGGTMKVT